MRKGKLVKVTFWDHSMDNALETRLFKCEVWGVLYRETNLAIYVATWICNNEIDLNTETFAIAKSTILGIDVFEEPKRSLSRKESRQGVLQNLLQKGKRAKRKPSCPACKDDKPGHNEPQSLCIDCGQQRRVRMPLLRK